MANIRAVWALAAALAMSAGMSAATAWAGGPEEGEVEHPGHIAEAVGSGVFVDGLAGFHASGFTTDEAAANVLAECQAAGGQECTVDHVTNENLCIVSVADDVSNVVTGGAGVTVEAAIQDALGRVDAADNTDLPPSATLVISDCP